MRVWICRILIRVRHPEKSVVLEVITHAGEIHHDRDVERRQQLAVADTRELEHLWCMDGSRGQNDLTAGQETASIEGLLGSVR